MIELASHPGPSSQLRLPPQVAPVCRSTSGGALADGSGMEPSDIWGDLFGIAKQVPWDKVGSWFGSLF